jgi:hypothetical protein
MPRGDRTGPMGAGPMTGWGAGDCGDSDAPSFFPRWGFGWGRGLGRGRGRRGFYPAFRSWDVPGWAPRASREQESGWLKSQAGSLQAALDKINERLQALDQE